MRAWRQASPSDPALRATPVALALCESCGTARSLGRVPEPNAHETSYYAPTRGAADRIVEPLRRLADRDRLRSLPTLQAGERVLEIGSGDGRFLAAARERGGSVVGIEPSAEARARAARLGIESYAGGVEDARVPPRSVGAVIAWHSLEHLDSPFDALRLARAWLKPGGALVVAVPNRASLQARIGGDRWFHQDVPRHRTHFTSAGAKAIVQRSGFEVKRVRHLLVEQNPLGMWQTLLNRLTHERDVAYRAIKRDPTVRGSSGDLLVSALAGPPLVPIAIGLELLAGVLRRGGSIVVEARAVGDEPS